MGQFSVTIYGATGSVLSDIQHLSGFNRLQQNDPNFPKPIKLGERAVGFSEREMDEYVQRVIENRSVVY